MDKKIIIFLITLKKCIKSVLNSKFSDISESRN